LEKFPIDKVVVEDFGAQLNSIAGIELQKYNQIHQADWNKTTQLSTNFQLNKLEIDFFDIPINKKFDLIYFDAFAPETQPELWTVEMFELMAKVLVKDGVLTTYCAKGYVKRNLRSAGFIVEALPGPPGKREITRAIKM
jgi:tRNA U34 5-methylaminomethyl-2-thiouridine-forming methyltransferase MnmC